MMIGIIIYLEIIQLNFCGFNMNTRKEIIKRTNDELPFDSYLYEEEKGLSYEQIKSMRKAAIIQLTYTNQINDLNTQISKLEGKWFGGSNKNKDLDNLKRQKGELINKEKEIKKKVEIEFKKIPNSEYSIISEDKEIVSKETSSLPLS